MYWFFYSFSRCHNHCFIETLDERSTRALPRLALYNSNPPAK